ncbi:PAS domain S-box protein [Priestia megaterium]
MLHRRLKESELKYRTLFEYANDAIYLLEIGSDHFPSRFVEVNEAGCKRLGYTREELLSMPCHDIIPRDSDIVQKQSKKFATEIFLYAAITVYV